MTRVRGPSFTVRFTRKGGVKTPSARDIPQDETPPLPKKEREIIPDIPDQTAAFSRIAVPEAPQTPVAPEAITGKTFAWEDLVRESTLEEAMQAAIQSAQATSGKEFRAPIIPQGPGPAEMALKEKRLRAAARAGDCHAIRVLVMEGVDLDARDASGRTAINIATQYNQREALKTLLAAKEMRRLARLGELPKTAFFKKFNRKQA